MEMNEIVNWMEATLKKKRFAHLIMKWNQNLYCIPNMHMAEISMGISATQP